jgi:pre-rRNA-processing protein TSR3
MGEADPDRPPPVVIVRHRKERLSKCTLEPLRRRPGFRFLRYPDDEPPPLPGYVRLALEAPPLGAGDREAGAGLLILDATWRLVEPMARAYAHVPPRSLPRLRTAYPRTSKLFVDPGAGLASIEALYAALCILGRPVDGVLDAYPGRERFLAENEAALAQAGSPAGRPPRAPEA